MDESDSTSLLPSFGSVRCDPVQDLCISADLLTNGTYSIISLSTGHAHASAHQGIVRVNRLKTVLDICGDYLLESHDIADFRTRVVVRNWKTGTVESSQIESPPPLACVRHVRQRDAASQHANAPCTVTVADYHPRRVARGGAAVAHGGATHGMHTLLPCIETRIPLPEDPARSLAAGQALGAWLCDNGVVFMETRDGEITSAWAYTF